MGQTKSDLPGPSLVSSLEEVLPQSPAAFICPQKKPSAIDFIIAIEPPDCHHRSCTRATQPDALIRPGTVGCPTFPLFHPWCQVAWMADEAGSPGWPPEN